MSDTDLEARVKALELILGKKIGFAEPPTEENPATPDSEQGVADENKHLTEEDPSTSAQTGFDESVTVVSEQQQQPQASSHKEVKAARPSDSALDYSVCPVGESLSEDTEFCPWNQIQGYPDRFIGKTNKPLARPFFDEILEGKVWDFFYLHDVESPTRKPYLLVPTSQFEFFLDAINYELNIALKIPSSSIRARFCMTFGEGGTPRPRYLKRTRDQKTLDIEEWPEIAQGDITGFEAATTAEQEDWLSKIKSIQTGRVQASRDGDTKARALKRQQDRMKMLHDAQRYMDPLNGNVNLVLVCMDVEAIEVAPNPVSEVGLAILDLALVRDTAPGPAGKHWWPFIKASHLRTKEYAGLVNYRFVQGCPDSFDFGTSTFHEQSKMSRAIEAVLLPYIERGCELVFVGHDGKQDIRLLSNIGFHVPKLPNFVGSLDTQEMHQAWHKSDNGRGLSAVLSDLFIASRNLHNAGNDAVYTLRAMIGVAHEAKRKWECEELGIKYVPSLWET